MGEWIRSELGVMNYIRGGFDKLFITNLEYTPLTPPQPSRRQAALSEEDRVSLSTLVMDVEIKEGLWALKAFKAPRFDGLHAGFFQRFWLIVGDLIRKEVKKASDESKVPEYLNRTNIVLISKIAKPESLGM